MVFPTFVVLERPKERLPDGSDHHRTRAGDELVNLGSWRGPGAALPAGPRAQRRTAIAVFADEHLTAAWAGAWFEAHPAIDLLSRERAPEAGALLFLAPRSEDQALRLVRRWAAGSELRDLPKVLVAPQIGGAALLAAVEHGVVSFLDYATTCLGEATAALIEADRGGSRLPGPLMRALVDQVRQRRDSGDAPRGSGLEPREVEVLRLLADGCDVREVAARLRYSESTVKGVIHGVVKRLGLRNRIEAVAYGIKVGAY